MAMRSNISRVDILVDSFFRNPKLPNLLRALPAFIYCFYAPILPCIVICLNAATIIATVVAAIQTPVFVMMIFMSLADIVYWWLCGKAFPTLVDTEYPHR